MDIRTDVKLFLSKSHDFYDIAYGDDGDFETTQGLDTALAISVLEEQRAVVEEVKQPEFRRGWCGTEDSDFEQGSKLWLWEGSRLVQSTLNNAETDTLTGLEWLIDDGLADTVEIVNSFIDNGIAVNIQIESDGNDTETTIYYVWGNTNAIGEAP